MQITDNQVPFGIRLALEERFTDCLGCQISETDMVTDILSYLLGNYQSIEDPERKTGWNPEEVLVQVGNYLTFISRNCDHDNSFSTVMARAMARLATMIHRDAAVMDFLADQPLR